MVLISGTVLVIRYEGTGCSEEGTAIYLSGRFVILGGLIIRNKLAEGRCGHAALCREGLVCGLSMAAEFCHDLGRPLERATLGVSPGLVPTPWRGQCSFRERPTPAVPSARSSLQMIGDLRLRHQSHRWKGAVEQRDPPFVSRGLRVRNPLRCGKFGQYSAPLRVGGNVRAEAQRG